MTRINNKVFIGLLIAVIAVGASIHALHTLQEWRNAQKLLAAADQAKNKRLQPEEVKGAREDLDRYLVREQQYLERYLYFRPDDNNVLARYGDLLSRGGSFESLDQAVLLLEKALRNDPTRSDDRVRLAELLLRLGRYKDLAEHAEFLLRPDPTGAVPQNGLAHYFLGRCYEAGAVVTSDPKDTAAQKKDARADVPEAEQYTKAVKEYELAKKYAPDDVRIYAQLALLLHEKLHDRGQADKVMDELVATQPKSARAYLGRSLYRSNLADAARGAEKDTFRSGAEADALRALELGADEANAILVAASFAAEKKDWKRGRDYLERGLKLHPQDPRMYLYRAELEITAGQLAAAEQELVRGIEAIPTVDFLRFQLANIWIDHRKFPEAEKMIGDLEDRGYDRQQLRLLQAREDMALQKWEAAVTKLDHDPDPTKVAGDQAGIRQLAVSNPRLAKQVDGYLAQCYERLANVEGNIEKLKAVYGRLLAPIDPDHPDFEAALVRFGRALEAIGRNEEALEQYRLAAAKGPAGKLAIAALWTRRNATLPPAQQRWDEVDKVLKAAQPEAKQAQDAVQVAIQQASVLMVRGKLDEAQALLETARKEHPDRVEIWIASIQFQERRGTLDAIPPLLDQADRALGDKIELRLARAQFLSLRGGAKALQALDDLARDLDQRPDAEQELLLPGLAEAHLRLGDPKGALAWWNRVVARRPGDLLTQIRAFDLAVDAGDVNAMVDAKTKIRSLAGTDVAYYADFVDASYEIWKAGHGKESNLKEARTLLRKVADKRPAWSRVPLAMASVETLEGNTTQALDQSINAINAGERDPALVRRTLEQLAKNHRFADASEILKKFQDQPILSGGFRRYAAEASVRSQDFDVALSLMNQPAATADLKDYQDHIWRAQMLAATGQYADAEAHFREAVKLAPQEPAPRVALVAYLAAAERTADAEAAMREAEAKLDPRKSSLALARCHELLTHDARVREIYQAALTADPDDETALRNFVDFLVKRGAWREAKPHLQHLIDLRGINAPDAPALTNLLDTISPERTAGTKNAGNEPAEQTRKRALLLASLGLSNPKQDDGNQRLDTINSLEKLVARDPLPEDRYVLALLYVQQELWPQADGALAGLMRSDPKNPVWLSNLTAALLQHGAAERAEPCVAELEKLRPNDPGTIELKAKLHSALAERRYKESHFDEAEATYRKAVDVATNQKNQRVLMEALNNLAFVLALADDDGKKSEALSLINQAIKLAGPNPKPTFFDTRGVIYLAMHRPDLAIQDLEKAVASDPAAANYFHLAQAYQAARRPGDAAAAIEKANEVGLDPVALDQREREAYKRLENELKQK
jgi:tetratricopeptide (TPR) repeat protein